MPNVELSLESGDQLEVRQFNILETISAAFRIDLIARSTDDAIDFTKIIGQKATLEIAGEGSGRTWTGVVANIAQTEIEPEGLSTYNIEMAPKLWLLTQRKNNRVFQHLSVPDIIKKLLGEWGVELVSKVKQTYPKLPMRVQYGESDYDFLRRTLNEAGISFFFHTEEGEETKVVLSDSPQDAEAEDALPFHRDTSMAQGLSYASSVNISSKVVPTKATTRDFDFRRPRYALEGAHGGGDGSHPLLEDYQYSPGSSVSESAAGGEAMGDSEGSYRHSDDAATGAARRKAEGKKTRSTKIGFSFSGAALYPGKTFSITGHPHPAIADGKKLLVTHCHLNGEPTGGWEAGGEAVSTDGPYSPSVDHGATHGAPSNGADDPYSPLGKLNKPKINGLQSAIVTGPAGEEIHTDEHGRVKVQFAWDREGKFDDKSSSWVRVAQAWAGAGFGNLSIPRVGQEVLIGFQDGDPDHPVVIGCMHNATSPVPYALPDNKTRTSFKSNSKGGANEITFDDASGKEMFYVQAQNDLHKIVKKDELELTQGNRHVHVDGDLLLSAKGRVVIVAGTDLVIKGGPNVLINPSEKPPENEKPAPLTSAPATSPARTKAAEEKPAETAPAESTPTESSTSSNDRLKNMDPGDRSDSRKHAASQKKLAEKHQADAIKVGEKHGVPPALVLGMMSRESDFGAALDSDGRGDGGHGYGILQVDDRTIKNPAGGPYSYEHLDQAMDVFDTKLSEVKQAHPTWTSDQQLAGAVAAYNSGSGNIHTQPSGAGGWAAMDDGTAHDNYSRDTWARAQWFADNLKW